MNMMRLRNYYILLITLPLVISCSRNMNYIPNELPPAKFGDNYYTRVELVGGVVRGNSLFYTIQPASAGTYRTTKIIHAVEQMRDEKIEGDGISMKCIGDDGDICNTIEIKGKINIKQDVIIGISGSTFGTSIPGMQFDKTFTIHVEE